MKILYLLKMALLFGYFVVGFCQADALKSGEVEKVFGVDFVLENIDAFDGKTIEVRGFLITHFEGNTICRDSDATFGRCLGVFFSKSDSKTDSLSRNMSIGLVSVRGVFKREDLGYEVSKHTPNGLMVQFGPYFHSLEESVLLDK